MPSLAAWLSPTSSPAVVQVDPMPAKSPRKPKVMRCPPQRAAHRDEGLQPVHQASLSRGPAIRGLRRLVPPAISVKRVGVDASGGRQRATELDDVVSDSGDRR